MNLIRITDLSAHDVRAIWELASSSSRKLSGTVGWSFEGNGIRTRTSFIQAFRQVGLNYVELPNLLKTQERVCDLAGYLDPFYDLYVIRDSNHARLAEFAAASLRPVINAMTADGHPCEVLSDAYFIQKHLADLAQVKVVLWGPPTNVLKSWHELARVLNFQLTHICDPRFHEAKPNVRFSETIVHSGDIVITDGWPNGYDNPAWSLNSHHLALLGTPKLLPTPPFTIGRELSLDPLQYAGFVGYEQKKSLQTVQMACITYLIEKANSVRP